MCLEYTVRISVKIISHVLLSWLCQCWGFSGKLKWGSVLKTTVGIQLFSFISLHTVVRSWKVLRESNRQRKVFTDWVEQHCKDPQPQRIKSLLAPQKWPISWMIKPFICSYETQNIHEHQQANVRKRGTIVPVLSFILQEDFILFIWTVMYCFQALFWGKPAPLVEQLSSKCLCADLGKHNLETLSYLKEQICLKMWAILTVEAIEITCMQMLFQYILQIFQIKREVGEISHFSALLSEILHYASFLFVFTVTKSGGIAGDNTLSCKECRISVLYWLFLSKVSCILSLRVHFPANQAWFGLPSGKIVQKTCFSCYCTCSLDKEQKVCFQNSIWKRTWLLWALKKDICLQVAYKPELRRREISSTD